MTPSSQLDQVLGVVDADLDQSLERLFAFLRMPSISTDSAYKEDCRRAAEWLAEDVASIGFEASARPTAGHPVVVGRMNGGAKRHALFYGHYDVQPVDPLNLWNHDPFDPKLIQIEKDRKVISARGACDDKGQVMTFVEACRAWKKATGSLPIGVTLMVEGEEESGSINLPPFVKANKKELEADLALVCDTGMWDRKTPAITTSLRGMVYEEIILRAANRDLHSGVYGGAAQNPIHILSRICGSLHDKNGRVRVPDFYKGVSNLPKAVKADLAKLKLTEKQFLGPIGLKKSAGEKGRLLIEQVSTRPTCDVNGIWGGYTGEGTKTVIAGEARAKVSFRLVGDQDPAAIQKNFRAFVKSQVPADCSVEFIGYKGSRAIQLPFDSPDLLKTRDALTKEWGKKTVMIGSGGSIPVVGDFKRTLGLDSLLVGFALDDDRVHSPNEKYDLSSFHKGVRSWVRILAALAE
ncbi:M20/M25/M40 family metallo-hydrolase [Terrarubrum flagellatum]|uniref:M20/M25/M40 family metallo-hydrolase n=1 Tax=Terrirubrum flagellatum TaxID=2895980 RepID=UPI003144FB01